jgi:hypothetical protein
MWCLGLIPQVQQQQQVLLVVVEVGGQQRDWSA